MDAWQTLVEHGLPDGPVRPARRAPLDGRAVAAAVRALAPGAGGLPERERELLLAWLAAFRHHWPRAFEAVLGAEGEALVASLRAAPHDANRYLKLRRIAIANLAGSL